MIKVVAIAVPAGLMFTGCLGNPTVPFDNPNCGAPLGSFVGRSSGASNDTLSGCAYFSVDTLSQTFAMVLTNGAPDTFNPMVQILKLGVPDTNKTYVVGSQPGQLSGRLLLGNRAFILTAGTFFRRWSADELVSERLHVSGTLDVTGTDITGAVLTVRGSFQGLCVTTDRADPGLEDGLRPRDRSCIPRAAG